VHKIGSCGGFSHFSHVNGLDASHSLPATSHGGPECHVLPEQRIGRGYRDCSSMRLLSLQRVSRWVGCSDVEVWPSLEGAGPYLSLSRACEISLRREGGILGVGLERSRVSLAPAIPRLQASEWSVTLSSPWLQLPKRAGINLWLADA
jgi:hypothetical protein